MKKCMVGIWYGWCMVWLVYGMVGIWYGWYIDVGLLM